MEKKYFGVYSETTKGPYVGLEVLEGIFENETSAKSFGKSSQIHPITSIDMENILDSSWYKLEPFRDRSKGKVWLTDFQRSAKYLHDEGYSMQRFSGEEVVEELGLVEKLEA